MHRKTDDSESEVSAMVRVQDNASDASGLKQFMADNETDMSNLAHRPSVKEQRGVPSELKNLDQRR